MLIMLMDWVLLFVGTIARGKKPPVAYDDNYDNSLGIIVVGIVARGNEHIVEEDDEVYKGIRHDSLRDVHVGSVAFVNSMDSSIGNK